MWCAWIAVAVVVLLATLRLADARSRAHLRRQVAALPQQTRRAILERIDRAGVEDGTPQLLLTTATADTASESWLFGVPDLPEDVTWPRRGDGAPARFVARIRLLAPPLPAVWHGRVVFLFDVEDIELAVRTAVGPGTRGAKGEQPVDGRAPVRLGTLRLPRPDATEEEEEAGVTTPAYAPYFLLQRVSDLRALLPQTSRPERLLPLVLEPTLGDVCLMGDEPELIQCEHEAACARCGASMRFLFQLGDVVGIRGDGPVVYVYGCDADPQEMRAFVDQH